MKSWVLTSALLTMLFATGPGCVDQYEEPLPPRDRLHYPIGVELHPSGRFLYVVNSNFDTRYREEIGGTVSVIDTETLEIRAAHSPFIPSFGGMIKLNADASKAYVTTRQGNEVVVLNVSEAGGALYCKLEDGTMASDSRACTISRLPDERGGSSLGQDPFGLDVTTITRTDAQTGDDFLIDLVNVAHLRGSLVSTISLPGQERASANLRSASLLAGGNHVVRRPGTMDFYVAGRSTNVVMAYQPYLNDLGQVEAIVRRGSVELNRAVQAVEARGLAFSGDGERLYVASRRPHALHIVAIDQSAGSLRHEVISSMPLNARPSDVTIHTDSRGRELLYIPSYSQGTIQVIDPRNEVLLDEIEVGPRPYQLVVDNGAARCRFPGDTCRGYVSLFDDSGVTGQSCSGEGCGSVAVIDLDPASARYHQVIAKIH